MNLLSCFLFKSYTSKCNYLFDRLFGNHEITVSITANFPPEIALSNLSPLPIMGHCTSTQNQRANLGICQQHARTCFSNKIVFVLLMSEHMWRSEKEN